ncbi:CheY chemotaxis protein or a CheY-like REC (receiver) domain [Malonomonas rubra DSM 5091]|uniref:CheY chemotaxis protein or a CheY-like REC (Receiver) domain n=1 Tax=Malonomonas rubra DSM 5091 TaxID=1122189 RepID=A0A1M6IUF3_MALRU|nr:response regulator [Malonomonas rubra]SHJ38083.1 CheY chemotaxis protein or a CheY-like REC (receiver) domain [Malonomonas rubra DSM 5091]
MLSAKNRPLSFNTLVFGNGETVLLVEREENLRRLGKDVLEKLNYQVVTASSQQELCCREDVLQQIDLLILDGAAPIRESKEIVQRVREFYPQAKTLFSSVHDTQLETECGRKIASERIINKPFLIEDFSQIVYRTLH